MSECESGVHFVRHAATAYNLEGRAMGTIDLPIVSADEDKIKPASVLLNQSSIGYTSPLLRARQTFKRFFPDVVPRVDARLRERELGEWEGLPWAAIRDKYTQAFLENGALDPRFTPPGGEPLDAFQFRISTFLSDLRDDESHQVVVVTHNGCIRMVRAMMGTVDIDNFFVRSESISRPYFVPWTVLRRERES